MAKAKLTADGRVRKIELKRLKPSPRNPRHISDSKLDALARSLDAAPSMLKARPLVALPDGQVIAGNQRLAAAQRLDWKELPTLVVDLSHEEADAWMVRDNEEFGQWDEPALAELLQQLQDQGIEIDTVGYDADELDNLLDATGSVPALPEEPFSGGFAETPEEQAAREARTQSRPSSSEVKREVVLLMSRSDHETFLEDCRRLEKHYGTNGIRETTIRAVREEAKATGKVPK